MVTSKRKQYLHFFLFVFPACFVCVLFILYPFIYGICSAFTDADWGSNTSVHYTGLENFTEIFDPAGDQRFLPRFNTHYLFKDNYELPLTIESAVYKGMLLKRIKNREELALLEKAYPADDNGNYILDRGYTEFALFDRLMILSGKNLSGKNQTWFSAILDEIREAAFAGHPLETVQWEPAAKILPAAAHNEFSGLLEQYYLVFKVKKILSTYLYKTEFILGVVGFTLLYTLINLLIANPVALLLAVALNRKILAARIVHAFLFLPYVLSAITVSFLCSFSFEIVLPFIIGEGTWLDNPEFAPLLIAFSGVWRNCGCLVLIYLAGLQAIPAEYREAATLDGANHIYMFLNITGPLLLPSLAIGIFWTTASSLKVFDLVFGLTRTSAYTTNTASWLLDIYINAYTGNRFGYAMAKVLLLSLVCILLTCAQYLVMKKQEAAK
ncbi:MAG: sugar ABC transporter permease [Spirochaetales bacterium]|nr:sugar ABC transporter permease [Spirochaetales bacterium]